MPKREDRVTHDDGVISALVVDDHRMARRHIGHLLAPYDWIVVVGEAEDGRRAVEQSLALRPEVLFLDVDMPVLSGFEVLEALHQFDLHPHVIFITAHDDFAVNAFDVHAVDYLLKPIVATRFDRALQRLKTHHKPTSGELTAYYRRHAPRPQTLTVQNGKNVVVLPLSDIVCLKASGNSSEVFTSDGHFTSNLSLNELESLLDQARFFRIHRAAICRISSIIELHSDHRGHYWIDLQHSVHSTLKVARRRYKALKALLES